MTRARGRTSAAVIAIAAASSLVVIACSVEKKEHAVIADSLRATPSPAATPAADTTIGHPVTSTGKATAGDSRKIERKPAPGATAKKPSAGGERDSAGTAVLEIGADGKLRRVKR